MIPENLRFISAHPDDEYFAWQSEVFLTNAREKQIANKCIMAIWCQKSGPHKCWEKIKRKYREVEFFFYPDTGEDLTDYIPRVRPIVLRKLFEQNAQRFKDYVFFYHDTDIIFNFLPDFEKLCKDDICWQSDTSYYLDYTYLVGKTEQGKFPKGELFDRFEKLTGVTEEMIKAYDKNTGGAQYILKGIDASFWAECEKDMMAIRTALMFEKPDSLNRLFFSSENSGFQSWCADMWAVNFNLWKRGKVTAVTKELDFSWATDSIHIYREKPIMHNAGVTPGHRHLFFKGAWINEPPFGKNIRASLNFASSAYVQAIKKVKV
jgi:hypothetical protein